MSIRNENINALFLFRETARDSLRQRVKDIARSASPHTNRIVCVLVQLIKVTSIIQFIIVKLYKREHIHRHFQKRSKIRLILHMYNKSWCVLWSLMLFLETLSLPCVVFWTDLHWDLGQGSDKSCFRGECFINDYVFFTSLARAQAQGCWQQWLLLVWLVWLMHCKTCTDEYLSFSLA